MKHFVQTAEVSRVALHPSALRLSGGSTALPDDEQLFHDGCYHGGSKLYACPTPSQNKVTTKHENHGSL